MAISTRDMFWYLQIRYTFMDIFKSCALRSKPSSTQILTPTQQGYTLTTNLEARFGGLAPQNI